MIFSSIFLAICLTIASGAPLNELTKGISSFALDFYQSVQSTPGNIIISPLSVASVLGLLSQATNGKTYEQLKNELHLNDDKTTTANQFHEYYKLLQRNAGNAQLLIANQIYVDHRLKIKQDFREMATKKFQSGVEPLDFIHPLSATREINHFVHVKTNGKIKDLILPNMISSSTQFMLINAIYFKGTWKHRFDKVNTKQEPFYTTDTDSNLVDFMHNVGHFNYAKLDELEATALAMKYANSSFSFVIVLPRSRIGLSKLEIKLKNYNLEKITSQMSQQKVEIKIPKFKTEFQINLNDALKKMGITEMFKPSADLTDLLESNDPLQVTDVVHKAFIEVNEEGTEGAAATGVGAGVTSVQKTPLFHADHPFVFFIRDDTLDTIIFSGRIEKFKKQ